MAKTVNSKTMNDLILKHLIEVGNISALEAQGIFKCRSLSRRICDLKDAGYKDNISRVLATDSQGQRYARYFFAAQASA